MIRLLANVSVILLSWCDGIATAAWALQELEVDIKKFYAWEVDRQAHAVAMHHFPDMEARGDLERDDMRDIPDKIREVDPEGHALVIM